MDMILRAFFDHECIQILYNCTIKFLRLNGKIIGISTQSIRFLDMIFPVLSDLRKAFIVRILVHTFKGLSCVKGVALPSPCPTPSHTLKFCQSCLGPVPFFFSLIFVSK